MSHKPSSLLKKSGADCVLGPNRFTRRTSPWRLETNSSPPFGLLRSNDPAFGADLRLIDSNGGPLVALATAVGFACAFLLSHLAG